MACYRPIAAYQLDDGQITFAARRGMSIRRELDLPCGQCVGCKLERSRQWAVRAMHEASLYEQNEFVTLTYRKPTQELQHRDFQLFMKRLRKKKTMLDVRTMHTVPRYLMCGEYGEQNKRPHFHACLFGIGFNEKTLYSESKGNKLWTSKELDDAWQLGHAVTGQLTFEAAAYIARYCIKTREMPRDIRVDTETGEITELEHEYLQMSRRPGIGSAWFHQFHSEVYPHDRVVVRGRECRPPRFYDQALKTIDPLAAQTLEFLRHEKAATHAADQTPARLQAREAVATARLNLKERSL